MKNVLFIALFVSGSVFAEDTTRTEKPNRNKHPLHRFYVATGTEMIFSRADLRIDSAVVESKLRFSIFPHVQQQYHYNLNKCLGLYTGFSILNVGFRNNITLYDTLRFELRQRSMSFGVPLALKIGDMENGNYVAFGATAECMFHYKYKLYYNNHKSKYADWLSDDVNLFNLAFFIDLRNKTGGFIRLKYYYYDFLPNVPGSYLLPESTTSVSFAPTLSSVFYISIGSTFMKKKPRPLTLEDV